VCFPAIGDIYENENGGEMRSWKCCRRHFGQYCIGCDRNPAITDGVHWFYTRLL